MRRESFSAHVRDRHSGLRRLAFGACLACACAVSAAPAEAAPLGDYYRNLEAAGQAIANLRQRLSVISEPAPGIAVHLEYDSPAGWAARDVMDVRVEAQQVLIAEFGGSDYEAFRAFVTHEFPDNSRIAGSFGGYSLIPPGNPLAFDDIDALLARLRAVRHAVHDMLVVSAPHAAHIEFVPLGGGVKRSVDTDDFLLELPLGLYVMTVSRSGFKQIVQTLNLVDQDPELIECTLEPEQSSGAATPCVLH